MDKLEYCYECDEVLLSSGKCSNVDNCLIAKQGSDQPEVEPECLSVEDTGVECEYVYEHNSWRCITHNCEA